tara:strand:+ start:702 stop:806 length:105 start_codon:yes stop_codon:yes gene_type:complete
VKEEAFSSFPNFFLSFFSCGSWACEKKEEVQALN